MTVLPAPAHRPARRPVQSPLAAHSHAIPPSPCPDRTARAVKSPRDGSLAEFADYLRTINNRNGRPYEEATVKDYVFPAKALNGWMTAEASTGTSPSSMPRCSTGTSGSTTASTAKAAPTPSSATSVSCSATSPGRQATPPPTPPA